jgi:hypothetical protein
VLWWLSLAVLAALPYALSLGNPLIHDDRTLLDNAWLRNEAGAASVLAHDFWFGTQHAGSDLYRPLTVLSLAWNLRWAPGRGEFHAVNLLLHAGSVLLVAAALRAIRRVLVRPRGAPFAPSDPPDLPFAAWAGAAIWAVHPLASEAVLLAVGRAEILAAGLGLASFLLFLRAEERDGTGGWPLAASAGLFLLALLAKESAAAWTFLLAAWWAARRAAGTPPRGSTLARVAAFGVVLTLYLVLRAWAVGFAPHAPPAIDNPLAAADVATRVANAVLLLGRYALKMLLPFRLTTEYGFDETRIVPLLPWGAAAAAGLVAAWGTILTLLLRRTSAAAAFLWAWIPAAFAVTGNLLFPIGTIFGERLAYMPLAGACGLAGASIAAIPGAAWRRGAAIGSILVLASSRTAVRAGDFRSLVAFHEATASASPRSAKALLNLGRTRLEIEHRPAEAADILARAAELMPDNAQTLRLLSKAYDATNRPDQAAEFLRRAEALPRDGERPQGGP